MLKYFYLLISSLCLGICCTLQAKSWYLVEDNIVAQDSIKFNNSEKFKALINEAKDLMKEYDFKSSLDVYNKAKTMCSDTVLLSSINRNIAVVENALSLTRYCLEPSVLAKKVFSKEDFFMYYPILHWVKSPNVLDSLGDGSIIPAMYVDTLTKQIIFSKKNDIGVRNIYKTELRDSVWTIPSLLSENLTTEEDEIFPIVSSDKKTIYFSSKGFSGIGGYDIYESHWDNNKKIWTSPINMGFPFSSLDDDYLYYNTDDGRYTIFASNRFCSKDSVVVYVLEYDNVPVRKSIDSPEALLSLVRLNLNENTNMNIEQDRVNASQISKSKKYANGIKRVKSLRDSVIAFNKSIDTYRLLLGTNDASKRDSLLSLIQDKEISLALLQDTLNKAQQDLESIEMQMFMDKDIVNMDFHTSDLIANVKEKKNKYVFKKQLPGEPIKLNFEDIEPEFDYTFRIEKAGALFAPDNKKPKGLCYQIQLISLSKQVSIEKLRGLTPIFLEYNSKGRYVYSVGLFTSYSDALSKLSIVKKLGFRSAFITAFLNSQEISIQTAKSLE